MRRMNLALFGSLMLTVLQNVQGQVHIAQQEKARAVAKMNSVATLSAPTSASADYTVNHYRLEWEIDPAVRYIRGKVTASLNITAKTSSIRFDLVDSLKVDSILYKNSKLSFSKPGSDILQVNFPATLNAGSRDSISIYYQGVPPTSGFGSFSVSKHAGTPVMWTLSEPYGSREWWPCRNGLDDKADSIDVITTTPDIYFATSNGVLAGEMIASGKRTTWWKHRYPIATYLVAVAATNYVIQQDTIQLTGRTMPFQQYVYPEAVSTFTPAIAKTKRIMRLFEGLVGPYPFRNERYAHSQVGFGGGMEHQTNSFMGAANEELIAHELAHQWFGDKVTCGSWQHIWLNEGFATFMTYMNFESYFPPENMVAWYKDEVFFVTSEKNGSVFVKDTSSVDRVFDYRLTYLKSGWVLQMLKWKLGDAAFYDGVKRYLNDTRVSYGFAVTDDLKRNMEAASGRDLDEFFDDWVYGEGYPSYQLTWLPVGSAKVQLVLNQTTSDPSVDFYEMPVPIQFRNSIRDTVIVIDHIRNGQVEIRDLGFIPDTAFIDPYIKLISANNNTVKGGQGPNNTVKIYPNPVGSQFTILLTNFTSPNAAVTIHNTIGQLLFKKELTMQTGNEILSIPSSAWPSGVYIVRVKTKDQNYVKRIVK